MWYFLSITLECLETDANGFESSSWDPIYISDLLIVGTKLWKHSGLSGGVFGSDIRTVRGKLALWRMSCKTRFLLLSSKYGPHPYLQQMVGANVASFFGARAAGCYDGPFRDSYSSHTTRTKEDWLGLLTVVVCTQVKADRQFCRKKNQRIHCIIFSVNHF